MIRPAKLLALGLLLALPSLAPAADPAGEELFEKRIRPLFVEHCARCHSAQSPSVKGGLRLDTADGIRKGGNSGPVVVPGKPEESLLLKCVRHDKAVPRMPPKETLPSTAVADLARWIMLGAPVKDQANGTKDEPRGSSAFLVQTAGRWTVRPLQLPPIPPVKDRYWPQTPVDAFLLARLEERGLAPAAPADRRTLIRRVTYDLTGLPPTPEEIDAFLGDSSRDAYPKLVERLLASPHYGEHWGRHWLDVVRYADTAGETADIPVPNAWRYRNYVLDAFNADKPYDVFLHEQLAGDLLAASAPRARYAELITATGYLAIARRFGYDINHDHYLTIEDTVDTLGKSVLGLTIGCARCHDHKYDPIPTTDYYALYGIFESTKYPFSGCEKERPPHDLVPLVPPGEVKQRGGPDKVELAYAVQEGSPHDAQLQRRGDPENRGESVPRRFLQLFGGLPLPPGSGSGRLVLAEWLTGPAAPLTARVLVNRVWLYHFGQGLLRTPNDFGTRGSPPSHPELLDYLARRFVDEGWSIKNLHRLIVLSAAYQQSSAASAAALRTDPDNVLLAHFPRRRLGAEEIRDTILSVAGDLDTSRGGPHPFPEVKTWNFTQHNPFAAVYDHHRRSVYLMTQRIKRHPFLALFDGADPNSSTGQRDATTVPTQALFFLNDPFVHAASEHLAARLLALPEAERLDRATRLCFGRTATMEERQLAARFLAESGASANNAEATRRAWASWARVLMASNEFLYVD